MMRLSKVEVFKYKSFQKRQSVVINPDITTIVGMNESGKTSFLTAIAKTNYFIADNDFIFDLIQDYPRNELIDFEESDDPGQIISCEYIMSEEINKQIDEELGEGVFTVQQFSHILSYRDSKSVFRGIVANEKKFLELLSKKYVLSEQTKNKLLGISTISEVAKIEQFDGDVGLSDLNVEINRILNIPNDLKSLAGYIVYKWIKPKMPKYWYFDDYYPLTGKININKLHSEAPSTERDKTSRALFELARIKPEDILAATDQQYEKYIALLEASANKITKEIFKYWSTNTNLDIDFKIQTLTNVHGQPEKYLDIRVKSQRHKVTLPLDRRSKGFNWFFSFIVWFSKIQADKDSDYILLLDEPGLNLHASAQADLLRFISDLSKKYQIVYTTHSPFMVESEHLDRVRTCLETEDGTIISDSIQEKDPNTLFPLQAALGYDIAQNLFISKNNLLVEGPADLIYLTIMSSILEGSKRQSLYEDITIVPVGGLDKVSTFISLLRGSKLKVACLLDTFTNQKGKQKVDDLIVHKIIKDKNIRFFDEFSSGVEKVADIEDMFEKEEYLKIFNATFSEECKEIDISDLDIKIETIIKQINKAIGKERFNHYRPANKLSQLSPDLNFFSKATLDRFENMFIEINKLF